MLQQNLVKDVRVLQELMVIAGNMEDNLKLFYFCLCVFAIISIHQGSAQSKIAIPNDGNIGLLIEHEGFCLSFDTITNCPFWVAWELDEEKAYSTTVKRTNNFRGDPLVSPSHRVEGYDYQNSNYDRGHMCPAADMKWSKEAMSDCFYMSNMCPQCPKLNRTWWERLEDACRKWTSKEGKLYICCGPIFENEKDKLYLGNEVKVSIPDKFYKVVLSLNADKEKAIGFIYSNSQEKQLMEDRCVSVDSIETITGFDFFPLIEDEIENKIEKSADLSIWN